MTAHSNFNLEILEAITTKKIKLETDYFSKEKNRFVKRIELICLIAIRQQCPSGNSQVTREDKRGENEELAVMSGLNKPDGHSLEDPR